MKHLIGGFALGFVFGLCMIQAGEDKPWGILLVSIGFSIAAWGLLP